jgi:hypothetical protein
MCHKAPADEDADISFLFLKLIAWNCLPYKSGECTASVALFVQAV